jgi:hypothetical protein
MINNDELLERIQTFGDSAKLSKEEIIYITDSWFEKFVSYTIQGIEDDELQDARSSIKVLLYGWCINFIGTKDNEGYNYKYGWMDPAGNFFSVGHGGHVVKAGMIIRSNKNIMMTFLNQFASIDEALEALSNHNHQNNPSDFLMKHGFVQLQDISNKGNPVAILGDLCEFTKKQLTSIFDLTFKYKFKIDPISRKIIDWSKLID